MNFKQLAKFDDGKTVVTVNRISEDLFSVVANVRPDDMTKTDLPTQTYIDLPVKFAEEVCTLILKNLIFEKCGITDEEEKEIEGI